MSFPEGFGDLRGQTFDEIFNNDPKNTEFVYKCWDRSGCTGVFLELHDYIHDRMLKPGEKAKHIARCKEYCKTTDRIPDYLNKYA